MDLNNPSVLVCDDNEMIVDLITHKLEKMNIKVIQAFDGDAALKIINEEKPSAIILDIMMPGMNGLSVLRAIKKEHATKNIPLILISGKKMEEDIVAGLTLGADEYMVKPFMPEELITRLKKLLLKGGYRV
jgi:DNA-binding response OmpR family regulator